MPTIEEVYAVASSMSEDDRMQLVSRLVHDLSEAQTHKSTNGIAQTGSLDALAMNTPLVPPDREAWKTTIGALGDDPVLQSVFEAGKRLREAERTSR